MLLVRTEPILCSHAEDYTFPAPKTGQHCAPCVAHTMHYQTHHSQVKGSHIRVGSAAVSGLRLGFTFLQALFCHSRTHVLCDLLPTLCRPFG